MIQDSSKASLPNARAELGRPDDPAAAGEGIGRFRRNLTLASLGAMLEYYDFVVYVYLATKIGAAFFPAGLSGGLRLAQTFGIYSIGFVIRPLAGLVIAHYADRFGRKRFFIFTVTLMSASTLLIGLLPTYASIGWCAPLLLLLLRVLQGCAVGGELPSAAVFVSEHARSGRLGFAGGVLQSMAYGGFLLGTAAAMVADFIASVVPDFPSLSWRVPFLIGGAFGLMSGYLRQSLEESPLFVEMRSRTANICTTPTRSVIRDHQKSCLFGFLAIFAMTITNVIYFQYWPSLLETQMGITHADSLAASLSSVVGIMISLPVWGLLYDRFGWAKTMRIGALVAALTSAWLFSNLRALGGDPQALIWAIVPVAIASGAVVAPIPGLLSSMFPTAVRQTGYALAYNVGVAAFGGPLPLILVWTTTIYGLCAPLFMLMLSYLAMGCLAYALRSLVFYLGKDSTI
ncbi:putative MFS family arabinose efflux permease [Paraburkholderia unamae]|uniref:MFS transporter n=1 Tax=Paraburkholderia unamae TaxID=219649 RepID=UPI000DC58C89|nr:MFS transporter [Paraburkholderia unamae]RAR54546.1 putative MFS family arabinose efflux permease [Paraburkholderia unamae]